jgi:putative peptidoglycan lipid II flippase
VTTVRAWLEPIRAVIDRVFPRGALILSVLSLAYFAMGIVRNKAFGQTFGTSAELDAYNAAFRAPELLFDVLVAAGLTAPFVPIYSRLRATGDHDASANGFGRTVLTVAVVVMATFSAGLFVTAPGIANLFGDFDASTRDLFVGLLRINCVAQVLFAASMALGEILVVNRRFLFYALAPILYTGGIIAGTVLFAGRYGIVATAWGAVAGAAAHLTVRAIGTKRTSFRIRPGFAVGTAAFREFVRLVIPRMFSAPIEPATVLYFTVVAAGLGVGNVSALGYGLDFQVLPVSLIGVSFSVAVFPVLSAAYAEGDGPAFRRVLRRNVVTIALLTTAAAIALAVLSGVLVEVILGGGAFGPDDVALTSALVAAFAVSIPFDALAYPLSRGLYATHNTFRQVVASFAGLAVVVAVTQLLVPSAGVFAIPFGYAAGMLAKDVLLALFLLERARRVGLRPPALRPPALGTPEVTAP